MSQTLIPWFVLAFGIGTAIGSLWVWLIQKRKLHALTQDINHLRENEIRLSTQMTEHVRRLTEEQKEFERLHTKLEEQQQKRQEAELDAARLTTQINDLQQHMQEKLSFQNETREHLMQAFKSLSADVLDVNAKRFLTLAKQQFEQHQQTSQADLDKRRSDIEHMVKPLATTLDQLKQHNTQLEKNRADAYGRMTEMVEHLRRETSQLAKAMQTPSSRGRWGEIQLRRVVELAGMVSYCDFYEQVASDQESSRQRPDLVVYLPESREIIVDAKAPLSAYLEAVEADDPQSKQDHLKQHATHIANHVRQLSSKKYWSEFDRAPEFVVLFVPGDHFLSAALEVRPDLIESAAVQRVLLATPATLIALLKAVAYGWSQQKMAENARVMVDLGKELYERMLKFAEHLDGVGKGLASAVKGYNSCLGSFEKRLMVTARKFEELGVESTKQDPDLQPLPLPDSINST
ncbi:MAG: DNA recombination protein RmuC [Acidobacteria bacterium]|nr:DNA recombination protein RmuC [Acidobacteriota bacterium]